MITGVMNPHSESTYKNNYQPTNAYSVNQIEENRKKYTEIRDMINAGSAVGISLNTKVVRTSGNLKEVGKVTGIDYNLMQGRSYIGSPQPFVVTWPSGGSYNYSLTDIQKETV